MAVMLENVSQLSKMIPKPERDVGCQSLIQMSNVSRYGFLRKMPDSWGGRLFDSVLNLKWSSKFVVLRSGCVYIYGSETASNYERANSLFGFQDVLQCSSDVYKAGKWVFQVVDALQDQERDRSMYFAANSENDMKEWINVFQKEICQGNLAVLSPSSPHDKLRPRPSIESQVEPKKVMPRLSEEMREKMRKSMTIETNFNIVHKELLNDSDENYSDIDSQEVKDATKKRTIPLPPLPGKGGDTAAKTATLPSPKQPAVEKSKQPAPPLIATKPKPIPANKTVPSPKPTNTVKPLPIPPSATKPSELKPPVVAKSSNFRDRTVPEPPGTKKFPNVRSVGDYEGGSDYDGQEYEDYERWDPEENFVVDPLVKASYWNEEADQALQALLTIKKDGVFLIRDASDGLDYKTLMVCTSEVESSVRKYKIIKEPSNLYSLHLGQSGFKSLQELLKYYQQNSLPNRKVKLTKPYTEVWKPK